MKRALIQLIALACFATVAGTTTRSYCIEPAKAPISARDIA